MTWRPKWGVATIALALIAAPGSAAPRRRVMSPRRLGRMTVELSALALVVAALYPAAPQASITVGSDLSLPATSSSENCVLSTPPCTRLLVGVHDGNPFPAKSPADGVILSFGLKTGVLSGANETVTFRLGRVGTITFGGATGAGTGPTVTVHEPGTYSFPAANLPVKAGDYLGFDSSSTRAKSSVSGGACFNGGGYLTYYPVLVDGGSNTPADANSSCELLVNAVIEPSNAFSFGKLNRNKKRGTATLAVSLPGPGELTASGKGVKDTSAAGAGISKTVGAAGTVKLVFKAQGKKAKKLKKKGKVGLKAKITYTPTGGAATTQTKKLKLKRKLKKR